MSRRHDDRTSARSVTVRRLWWAFAVLLTIVVLGQLLFPFGRNLGAVDGFGFAAVFGFAAGAVVIILAALLGRLLGRPDGYYDD